MNPTPTDLLGLRNAIDGAHAECDRSAMRILECAIGTDGSGRAIATLGLQDFVQLTESHNKLVDLARVHEAEIQSWASALNTALQQRDRWYRRWKLAYGAALLLALAWIAWIAPAVWGWR